MTSVHALEFDAGFRSSSLRAMRTRHKSWQCDTKHHTHPRPMTIRRCHTRESQNGPKITFADGSCVQLIPKTIKSACRNQPGRRRRCMATVIITKRIMQPMTLLRKHLPDIYALQVCSPGPRQNLWGTPFQPLQRFAANFCAKRYTLQRKVKIQHVAERHVVQEEEIHHSARGRGGRANVYFASQTNT